MNNYIKPDIDFQPMALATSASASCGVGNTQAQFECPAHITDAPPDWTVFTATNSGCKYTPGSGFENFVCYHVPMADHNIFES